MQPNGHFKINRGSGCSRKGSQRLSLFWTCASLFFLCGEQSSTRSHVSTPTSQNFKSTLGVLSLAGERQQDPAQKLRRPRKRTRFFGPQARAPEW